MGQRWPGRQQLSSWGHIPRHAVTLATADGVIAVETEAVLLTAIANRLDVREILSRPDGRAWQAIPPFHALRDELDVTFAVPAPGEYALVATAENTRWYEHVVRSATEAPAYTSLLAAANRSAEAGLARWRNDAGVDLDVTAASGIAWRATPFGTAGFRTQVLGISSVPPEGLPDAEARPQEPGRSRGQLSFSLSSAAGIWRIDSLRLMSCHQS